jgi:hypothetical protein
MSQTNAQYWSYELSRNKQLVLEHIHAIRLPRIARIDVVELREHSEIVHAADEPAFQAALAVFLRAEAQRLQVSAKAAIVLAEYIEQDLK